MFFFFKQKTAYEMRISDWSSDVCSSDLYPGGTRLVPADADLARQTRLCDRFYDLYVQEPMQKIVTDRLRPAGKSDPYGVEQARTLLGTAYGMIDRELEIGRAACRERVGQCVWISVVAVVLKKKKIKVER